mmetsp:Transcript_66564/g.124204  ORF Transcript_66564/g.124204 Transcript_66564/m.124204 type:complete len:192 (+) Transcript_66564:174-749(+)
MKAYSGIDVPEAPLPHLRHFELTPLELLKKESPADLDMRIKEAQEEAAGRRGESVKNIKLPKGPSSHSAMLPQWLDATPCIMPEQFLGGWVDSLGNAVLVSSVDAYSLRLVATLSQPPRKDIHLALKPMPGGGWQCGNACLDPVWSCETQLHWLTGDGRISVWVRLQEDMLQGDLDAGDLKLDSAAASSPA